MSTGHSGRLELTWTNKDKTLLAHEDGRYEWVDPADYRVAEVRLLHDVTTVGSTSELGRAADNLLVRGDALHALHTLNRTPEFAKEYVGKVRLCYIDPPFNTGQTFDHYDDNLEHSVWLTMLRDRLVQIRPLLAEDGSVWVHLDDAETHRCRSVLDEVMGTENFVAEVVWRAADSSNNDAKQFSLDHNTILVYSRQPGWRSIPLVRGAENNAHYSNPDDDPRGEWFPGNVSSPNPRENLRFLIDESFGWTGTPISPPANGWRWQPSTLREKLSSGEIVLVEQEPGRPRLIRKTYLADQGGLAPSTLWGDIEVTGHNRQAKYELKKLFPDVTTSELFKTPKPERLLHRVMQVATQAGDIVLDCFAGSGTTAAVAHKLGRRWVTIEWSADVLATFTLPRLHKVVCGEDPGGVTSIETPTGEGLPDGIKTGEARAAAKTIEAMSKAGALDGLEALDPEALSSLSRALRAADKTTTETIWSGGGGFRVLEVGPSMFAEVDGRVYLADWATNGALAEAIAAQYGYANEPDPPFAGRKGRTRLAVVDGLVNEGVVRLLVDSLPPGERVAICGTAVDPGARTILKELRPGSTMRKVPAALLDEYRQSRREWLRLASAIDWSEATEMIERDLDSVDLELS
jgi:adenine-specific DNA-methyltransferase